MEQIIDSIFVGEISDVHQKNLSDYGVNHVITVCQDKTEDNVGCEYSFYNMSDGPDNKYGGDYGLDIYSEAANDLYNSVMDGNTVFIHCHKGQSRSVAVIIGVIGRINNLNLDSAIEFVVSKHPIADPDDILIKNAKKYIQKHN